MVLYIVLESRVLVSLRQRREVLRLQELRVLLLLKHVAGFGADLFADLLSFRICDFRVKGRVKDSCDEFFSGSAFKHSRVINREFGRLSNIRSHAWGLHTLHSARHFLCISVLGLGKLCKLVFGKFLFLKDIEVK